MSTRIYIANLSPDTTRETLVEVFAEAGATVTAAEVLPGRTRSKATVDLSPHDDPEAAIRATDGIELDGCSIRVSAEAEPEPARPRTFDDYDYDFADEEDDAPTHRSKRRMSPKDDE